MDSGAWSIILSLVGLALGFVSAYGQIKSVVTRLFSFSAGAAKRRAERFEVEIDAFARNPSALIAHITGVALSIVAVLLLCGIASLGLTKTFSGISSIVRLAVGFAFGAFIGFRLGSLSFLVRVVKKRAIKYVRSNG